MPCLRPELFFRKWAPEEPLGSELQVTPTTKVTFSNKLKEKKNNNNTELSVSQLSNLSGKPTGLPTTSLYETKENQPKLHIFPFVIKPCGSKWLKTTARK